MPCEKCDGYATSATLGYGVLQSGLQILAEHKAVRTSGSRTIAANIRSIANEGRIENAEGGCNTPLAQAVDTSRALAQAVDIPRALATAVGLACTPCVVNAAWALPATVGQLPRRRSSDPEN